MAASFPIQLVVFDCDGTLVDSQATADISAFVCKGCSAGIRATPGFRSSGNLPILTMPATMLYGPWRINGE